MKQTDKKVNNLSFFKAKNIFLISQFFISCNEQYTDTRRILNINNDIRVKIILQVKNPFAEIIFNKDKISKDNTIWENDISRKYKNAVPCFSRCIEPMAEYGIMLYIIDKNK